MHSVHYRMESAAAMHVLSPAGARLKPPSSSFSSSSAQGAPPVPASPGSTWAVGSWHHVMACACHVSNTGCRSRTASFGFVRGLPPPLGFRRAAVVASATHVEAGIGIGLVLRVTLNCELCGHHVGDVIAVTWTDGSEVRKARGSTYTGYEICPRKQAITSIERAPKA